MNKSKYVGLLLLGFMAIGVTGGVWTSNEFIYKPTLGARGQTEKDRFDVSMDRVDNRLGKEIWVGDPNYGTTVQDAITAIGSNGVSLHIPAGTHNIGANLTIPVNVTLKPERGAILTMATTKTLTINGGFEAGLYQVFSCTGTGTVVFGNKVPKVYVQWFGAVGDGSTDDGTAINQAATCARASTCKWITFPQVGNQSDLGYFSSMQLDLRILNVEAPGTCLLTDLDGSPFVLLGGPETIGGSTYSCVRRNINLYVRHTVGDWVAGTTGILITDLNTSDLDLQAYRFETGIEFRAGIKSCCYNNIRLREMLYNKVGLLVSHPTGAGGWVNENKVFGGNFGGTSGYAQEACIKFLGGTAVGERSTGWVFYGPALEHYNGVGAIFSNAIGNSILNCRYEQNNGIVAQFTDRAKNNIVTMNTYYGGGAAYSFDLGAPTDAECYDNDVKMSKEKPYQRVLDVTNFDSVYKMGSTIYAPGFEFIGADTNEGIISRTSVGNYNFYDHGSGVMLAGIGTANAVGRKIGFVTAAYKAYRPNKLYVKPKNAYDANVAAKIVVFCYNSTGALLTGDNPYYVKGYMTTSVSNHYVVQDERSKQIPFGNVLLFHPDVAMAFIGVNGGTHMTGLDIYSPYQIDLIPTVGPKEYPGYRVGAGGPPGSWHFQRGEVIWNANATTGAAPGWMCIKRVDTTLTADASSGNLTITVADIAGIASGDVIGVKLNTGLYHFTTVNGAPSGSTVTLTAALSGTGVVATSGNAVVVNLWKAMPNL